MSLASTPGAAQHPLLGVLLLDKPLGLSSNAALQKVRRLAGGIKAGHGGSLDPLASGMLPICLGEATRLAGQLLDGRKAYRFELQLGQRSASGDAEGPMIGQSAVPALSAAQVQSCLRGFLGERQQRPPMFSAVKSGGQPLYRLARAGQVIERAPRAIRIDRLELLELAPTRLRLLVECSKGTYVRVLGEEIASALGTCGYLCSLRRDYVEPFAGEAMYGIEQLEHWRATGAHWPLLAPDRAVGHLPELRLTGESAESIGHGRELERCVAPGPPRLWRLYDAGGRFLGLGCSSPTGGLRARRLFSCPLAV